MPGWLLGPENQRKGLRALSFALSLLLILPEGKTIESGCLGPMAEALGILSHVKGLGEAPGSPEPPGASGPGRSKQVTQMKSRVLDVDNRNYLN